jgi:hypothetical protein
VEALDAPLGMTLAPNRNLVVVNGNIGNAVKITNHPGRQATRHQDADQERRR